MAENPNQAQEHPDQLVAVILKFGDVLAETGRVADARTQFELAAQIAQRGRGSASSSSRHGSA